MENKEFDSLVEYEKWLSSLPEPCSGTPPENGKQDIMDGDGNQYVVSIKDHTGK